MELEIENQVKTTNFRVVAIDETHSFTDENLVKQCGKLSTVYFYDANERTHCCEITPSYYLMPLYIIAENEISDEIDEELMNIHWKYNTNPIYMHCHVVDDMKTIEAHCNAEYEETDSPEHKEILDSAEENLRANHLI